MEGLKNSPKNTPNYMAKNCPWIIPEITLCHLAMAGVWGFQIEHSGLSDHWRDIRSKFQIPRQNWILWGYDGSTALVYMLFTPVASMQLDYRWFDDLQVWHLWRHMHKPDDVLPTPGWQKAYEEGEIVLKWSWRLESTFAGEDPDGKEWSAFHA